MIATKLVTQTGSVLIPILARVEPPNLRMKIIGAGHLEILDREFRDQVFVGPASDGLGLIPVPVLSENFGNWRLKLGP